MQQLPLPEHGQGPLGIRFEGPFENSDSGHWKLSVEMNNKEIFTWGFYFFSIFTTEVLYPQSIIIVMIMIIIIIVVIIIHLQCTFHYHSLLNHIYTYISSLAFSSSSSQHVTPYLGHLYPHILPTHSIHCSLALSAFLQSFPPELSIWCTHSWSYLSL